jgi:hypothetical protein
MRTISTPPNGMARERWRRSLAVAGGSLLLAAAFGLGLLGALSIVFRGLAAQPIDGVTRAMVAVGLVALCAAAAVFADHSIGDAFGIAFGTAGIAVTAVIAVRGTGDAFATIVFPIAIAAWSVMLLAVCGRRARHRFVIPLSDAIAFGALVLGLVVVGVLLR